MSELFGTPSGFRTYDKDQAELGLIASQAQHQRALAGLNNAQADVMRRKQTSDEELLKIVAGSQPAAGPGGQPVNTDTVLSQMSRAAGIYASLGRFDEAGKLIKDVSQATENFAQGKASQASQAATELRANIARMRALQERLATINSPQKHAEVLMQLQSDPVIGGQIPDWLKTYNPAAIAGFVAGSPAQIQQAELRLKQADEARKEGDSANLRKNRDAAQVVRERLAKATEDRVARLGKVGGGKDTGVGVPSEWETEVAVKALKDAGFGSAAKDAASEIAERAKILRTRNPALGPTEALDRAIAESRASGELDSSFWKPNTFTAKAGSISRPLPMPKADVDAKVGQYFRLPNGSLVKKAGPDDYEIVSQPMKAPQITPRDPVADLFNDTKGD